MASNRAYSFSVKVTAGLICVAVGFGSGIVLKRVLRKNPQVPPESVSVLRRQAMGKAIKEGRSTYEFTTTFMPVLGQ